jgi:hypothetical protein
LIALVAALPVGVKHDGEAAAINNEPAGEEVDRIADSVCGDLDKFRTVCIAPGEVVIELETLLTALEPKRAQAFFHLH